MYLLNVGQRRRILWNNFHAAYVKLSLVQSSTLKIAARCYETREPVIPEKINLVCHTPYQSICDKPTSSPFIWENSLAIFIFRFCSFGPTRQEPSILDWFVPGQWCIQGKKNDISPRNFAKYINILDNVWTYGIAAWLHVSIWNLITEEWVLRMFRLDRIVR